ncbi:MAG: isoleucine--tRNA ligase [Candidatus Krumholzibacteria bacterium]|nr:isoleucine--tRNA ligase [Candidatus Krumholzibacteria bacterium]
MAKTTSGDRKPAYPALASKFHDSHSEELISGFWKEDDTFRRSIAQREGAPEWVFYEGPPTANGLPGVHHVMARLCKDVMCRFKTMTGHRVVRKAGWDTHGLPVERAVEKILGIQGAQAIQDFGLVPFNEKCRESVWTCKTDWDEFTERLGYWVDLDDPYITYDNNYIETVWWILSRFHAEDMLYKGHKVVPYCPVCATPISSHEMANSYRTVTDPSIYVKLKATDADEYFVTWTTTPWTLPSNVALAVGVDFDYVRVRHGDEILILAEARLGVLDPETPTEVLDKFKGADLLGRTYEQLLPFVSPAGERAFVVVEADFVTLDSGTGIVHMAPAFGEDDYQIGKREKLAFFKPVDANGQFTEEVTPWAGLHVKKADRKIIRHLQEEGKLLREEIYSHDYPFHDRCDNPLIYFATPSWFIKTSSMRDQLVEANKAITWAPPEVGSGRFGNWLAGNIDWSLSRNRFWGTPLNIWICDDCGHQHMPTCRADLSELTGDDHSELDLHRPHVDNITFGCKADGCSGTMRRTSEVIDCWFDSGSMPFAQYHYPFENKELFESQFPADFISEGIDQTRGWFYTMLVISTFLKGTSSYKSCLVNELILDKKGKKMSKSVGNTVNPMDIMRTVGADPLRWYMVTCSPVWTTTRFDGEGVKEAQRKLLATLENTYNFFSLYANLDGFAPADGGKQELDKLDHWILSRLQSVTRSVTADLESLHLTRAAKTIGTFILDDVSNWYLRLSRRRFWKGEMTPDKRAAFTTLYTVLESSLRLLAPFIPFVAEEIFRALTAHADPHGSVHLQDFPVADESLIDEALEKSMAAAQAVVGLGRSLRQDASLKTRQPLGKLVMHADDDRVTLLMADELLTGYIAGELNVKEVGTVADPREIANLSAKANFRALGPRFGKRSPLAAKRITSMTSDEIMTLRADGRVGLDFEGEDVDFTFEEVMVVEEGVGPFVATGGQGLTVALDTTLTKDLKQEGLAREIINKVQNLRKKSGLEVSDRINLAINGPEDVLTAVSRFSERISTETLALDVASNVELAYKDTFKIDENEIGISLDRV